MKKNPYKCPKCGATDILYMSVETVILRHHVINGDFVSQKITPIEMGESYLECNKCGNQFEYSEEDDNETLPAKRNPS